MCGTGIMATNHMIQAGKSSIAVNVSYGYSVCQVYDI